MTVEFGETELRLRFSFVAVITVMLLFCDEKIVLMSLFSSIIHESGHLFLMCLFGDRIHYVELSLFGMRIEKHSPLLSYKKEALIAMGGILLNFLFALFGFVMYLVSKSEDFLFFIAVNGFIALINMIPVKILDFGRCIHCFLSQKYDEEKGEKIMDFLSMLCALILSLLCVIYCIFIKLNISFIAVSLYLNIITFKKKWS